MRAAILALADDKTARLAALFGDMTTPYRDLGELRPVLRFIATLDDADLDRLAKPGPSRAIAYAGTGTTFRRKSHSRVPDNGLTRCAVICC